MSIGTRSPASAFSSRSSVVTGASLSGSLPLGDHGLGAPLIATILRAPPGAGTAAKPRSSSRLSISASASPRLTCGGPSIVTVPSAATASSNTSDSPVARARSVTTCADRRVAVGDPDRVVARRARARQRLEIDRHHRRAPLDARRRARAPLHHDAHLGRRASARSNAVTRTTVPCSRWA